MIEVPVCNYSLLIWAFASDSIHDSEVIFKSKIFKIPLK